MSFSLPLTPSSSVSSRAFAKEGYSVALIGRRDGQALVEELKNSGADVSLIHISQEFHLKSLLLGGQLPDLIL